MVHPQWRKSSLWDMAGGTPALPSDQPVLVTPGLAFVRAWVCGAALLYVVGRRPGRVNLWEGWIPACAGMTENIKLESDGLEPGAFDLGDCGELVVTSPDQVATVFPYPRDEGTEEFMVVDFDLFAAAFLQVPVDSHKGWEPEAGLDYPEAEGTRLGQGFTVGEGDEPLEAKFFDQAAKPDDGQFLGHFLL